MFCKTIILGCIGNKEDKTLQNGTAVSKLSIATKKRVKDAQGQYVDDTTWHDVTVYGTSAKFIQQYCNKGDTVLIEGANEKQEWVGKDGKKNYRYYVNAYKVAKVKDGKSSQGGNNQASGNNANNSFDDDIPW